MRLKGQVVDNPIPGAAGHRVAGRLRLQAVADASGNYVLDIASLTRRRLRHASRHRHLAFGVPVKFYLPWRRNPAP
jgi:hypothetical protein